MKTKYYLAIATAAALFAACTNDENVTDNGPVEARVTAGVNNPVTRAIDNQWEQDKIGVMATSPDNMKALYRNVLYTTDATTTDAATFTSTNGIFFQKFGEEVTFTAYAPYKTSPDNQTLPGTEGSISGSTASQSSRDLQKSIDYIFASSMTASQGNPTIEFTFKHKMTRLIIIVKTSATDGFTAAQVTGGTYTLGGLKHSGTFDVTTGNAAVTENATDSWSLNDNSLQTPDETEQCTFTSILYPQMLASPLSFTATIDGQNYTNTTKIQPELKAGNSYTYTITVKKTGLTVSGCKIESWGTGQGGDGDATM